MHPSLFSWGHVTFQSLSVFRALGFVLGFADALRRAELLGLDLGRFKRVLVLLLVSGCLGGRWLEAALNWDWTVRDPIGLIAVWLPGGFTWYGGLILALATVTIYMRLTGMPVLRGWDALLPGAALGLAVGRVGCLLAGCCYGAACDWPWGMRFDKVDALARHPTQLYETLALLGIWRFLDYRFRQPGRVDGSISVLYLFLAATERFLIEIFRDDLRGEFVLGVLSPSQAISLGLVVFAAGLQWSLNRHRGSPCHLADRTPAQT